MLKSTSRNGFGLKEIRPNAPRNNRMGRSPPISFLLRPARGVRKKIIKKSKKSKSQKSQNGLGLKEVRPRAPRNNRMGQSPPISFFLLRPAPGFSKKNQKNQKSQSGIGLKEVGPKAPRNNITGRSPPITKCG